MSNAVKTITIDAPRGTTAAPTRVCLVCDRKEDDTVSMVDGRAAWLCDRCREALLNVVKETEKGGE